MQWRARFSLRVLLLLVAFSAVTTFIWLNARRWRQNYSDWVANRAIKARAERVFRDETGQKPPPQLVHILGSGDLSHWARVYDIGLTAEQIISCGHDHAVRCWSADTGESLQVIADVEGHLSANSSLLAAIDSKKRVQVYDTSVSPLKLLREFSLPGKSAIRKVFCSRFDAILAVTYDVPSEGVEIFNLDDGTPLPRLRLGRHADEACFGFGTNGRLLAACSDELLLFNTMNGELVNAWKQEPMPLERQAIGNVVPLQEPWWLVVGAVNKIVWNEQTGDWKAVEICEGGTPNTVVSETPANAWVANGGFMWRISMNGDQLSKSLAPTTPVMPISCIAFRKHSGGGQVFTQRAIGFGTGQVGILDEFGRLRLPIRDVDHITNVAWNRDGSMLAAGTSDGEIVLMRTGTWVEVQRFRAHGGAVKYVEFSPDGTALLTEERHEIAVFDWNSGKAFVRKSRQGSPSRDATLSSGKRQLLTWVLNQGWTLTDYVTNTRLATSARDAPRPQPFSPIGPVWSTREESFVFVSDNGFCRLKVVGEGSELGPSLIVSELPDAGLRYLKAFSVEESQALFVEYAKEHSRLKIWNWQSAAASTIQVEPFSTMPFATFTPSGREVAIVNHGDLLMYSQSGQVLFRQAIGPSHISGSAIQFSPEGRYMAIVNGNGTCYLLKNPLD